MKFEYDYSSEKIDKALNLIKENGGFNKNSEFTIHGIKGNITNDANRNKLIIDITSKPFLISWGFIKTKLDYFFK